MGETKNKGRNIIMVLIVLVTLVALSAETYSLYSTLDKLEHTRRSDGSGTMYSTLWGKSESQIQTEMMSATIKYAGSVVLTITFSGVALVGVRKLT